MAMYLAHVPVFTIMLLGCWSSDAVLRHIRKQVKELSNGISSKMIQHEHFFTKPSSSSEDPRVPNNTLNLACCNNHDLSFKDTVRPLASVFHSCSLLNKSSFDLHIFSFTYHSFNHSTYYESYNSKLVHYLFHQTIFTSFPIYLSYPSYS